MRRIASRTRLQVNLRLKKLGAWQRNRIGPDQADRLHLERRSSETSARNSSELSVRTYSASKSYQGRFVHGLCVPYHSASLHLLLPTSASHRDEPLALCDIAAPAHIPVLGVAFVLVELIALSRNANHKLRVLHGRHSFGTRALPRSKTGFERILSKPGAAAD